jgi:hypothetical protein
MAHFAKIGINNIVTQVLVVANRETMDSNGVEHESIGVNFLKNLTGHETWVQTSYNNKFRKNYAGIGYTYDSQRNAFIPPKPFNSWILNEETCLWEAPVAMPELTQEQIDNKNYYAWNEQIINWEIKTGN